MSIKQIEKKIIKARNKSETMKTLFKTAFFIGCFLLVATPFMFLFGMSKLAVTCLIVSLLQSLAMAGFIFPWYNAIKKEIELTDELNLRKQSEKLTKEYQKQYAKEQKKSTTKFSQTEQMQKKEGENTKSL